MLNSEAQATINHPPSYKSQTTYLGPMQDILESLPKKRTETRKSRYPPIHNA